MPPQQAERRNAVIPAKAGIHFSSVRQDGFACRHKENQINEKLDSRFRGLTPGNTLSFGLSSITELNVLDSISFTGLSSSKTYKVTASLFSTDGLTFRSVTLGDKSFSPLSGGGLSWAMFGGEHGGSNWTMTLMGRGDRSASYQGLIHVSAVPEPETYALMAAGLGVVGWVARRRRQQQ